MTKKKLEERLHQAQNDITELDDMLEIASTKIKIFENEREYLKKRIFNLELAIKNLAQLV